MLFLKECKKVICSMTFVLFVVTVVAMYITQYSSDLRVVVKPRPGQADYGVTIREDPGLIMSAAVDSLLGEYLSGNYTAYPIGLYKNVRLKESKRLKMRAVLEELTGLSGEEIDGFDNFAEEGFIADGVDEEGNLVIGYPAMVFPSHSLRNAVCSFIPFL